MTSDEAKMMDEQSFMQWMNKFIASKQNQLEYSQRMSPKRMQKLTLDLSTAPAQPLEINVPFNSLVVSRIYSTATPTTDKAGTVKVLFDTPDLANIQNAISLFPNDTIRMKNSTRKGFFTWDAQSDTSVDLFLFPDIEVIAGTTKTQIVGTVSTQNSNATSFYNKPPIPDSVTAFNFSSTGSGTIGTVPAGKYWIVKCGIRGSSGVNDDGQLIINTGSGGKEVLGTSLSSGQSVYGEFLLKAGHVLSYSVNHSSTGSLGGTYEEYSV